MQDQNTIWTNASLTPDLKPCVMWRHKSYKGVFSLPETRTKAMGLLQAAAIAQVESNIAIELSKSFTPKGFAKNPDADKATAILLNLVRNARQPLIDGVKAIFGLESKLPLLNVCWYGEEIQMEMTTASFHAEVLLRTAEAAESDSFLRFFLSEKCNISIDYTQEMIQEFAQYRNKQSLEQLFGSSK
jgi:hypothetical protein